MKNTYVKLEDVLALLSADLKNTNDAKAEIKGDDINAQSIRAVGNILAQHTSVLTMTVMSLLKTYEFDDGKD